MEYSIYEYSNDLCHSRSCHFQVTTGHDFVSDPYICVFHFPHAEWFQMTKRARMEFKWTERALLWSVSTIRGTLLYMILPSYNANK